MTRQPKQCRLDLAGYSFSYVCFASTDRVSNGHGIPGMFSVCIETRSLVSFLGKVRWVISKLLSHSNKPENNLFFHIFAAVKGP